MFKKIGAAYEKISKLRDGLQERWEVVEGNHRKKERYKGYSKKVEYMSNWQKISETKIHWNNFKIK